ncbi:hypothetical protein F5877DRAFT_93682 [Lentinula edodes]|nr:hypothetical protein F5877DRAFT_93682 [Lentinula edodes]
MDWYHKIHAGSMIIILVVRSCSMYKNRTAEAKYAREQISDRDLTRLKLGGWLNDEIINFYRALIMGCMEKGLLSEQSVNPTSVSKAYVGFTDFSNGSPPGKAKMKSTGRPLFYYVFWRKLSQCSYKKGHLATWTKKVDLFSKDIILVPINHNNVHWSAATVNFRQKRIESYDSYLNAEHQLKKGEPFDFTGRRDHSPEYMPQQTNLNDCGVFTCQSLEGLSRDEEIFTFNQDDKPYFRRRMLWETSHLQLSNV